MDFLRDGLSGLADLLLPAHCAGCAVAGTAWCRECAAALGGLRRVERPLLTGGPPVYALGQYRGVARRAVLAYKESGYRQLAAPLARQLAVGLRALIADGRLADARWLVPAPSRAIASRRRGGAHMARLARKLAAEPITADEPPSVADCLVTAHQAADSAGLDASARRDNLAGRVRLRTYRIPPRGARVVLLDDVVTTGATVATCSEVLTTAGVRVSVVLSLTATAKLPNG